MFNGWIKLHRKILDHWVSQEPEMLAVWIRLLAEANHSDTRKMFNGALIEIKRGQLIFGLNAFSSKSGVSVAKLRRFLKMFETDNMISKQNASKYSLITITCFDQYQVIDKQNASTEQADDKQTTSRRQHYKNEKNVENEKNDEKKESGGNPPQSKNKFSDDDLETARWMFEKIKTLNPGNKPPSFESWAGTIRLIRERDKKTDNDIRELFTWANNHSFWQVNILSPGKLREQWDRLTLQKGQKPQGKKESYEDGLARLMEWANEDEAIEGETVPERGITHER